MNALPPDVVSKVESQARATYKDVLDPIATRFEFESSPQESESSGLPMVLLLGNHSSGKSSFINYLVGEDLQRTGIAPVDDGFTIITHSEESTDKDGAAVVTDPTWGWGDLGRFGPTLTSHLKLRLRPQDYLKGIALVDSPGMIDAADTSLDRGYDFPAVVRWFAERADVILLLFDPDKPGTTGETLKVLTDSLAGLDHKLLLIFNKVDRFQTMRDFARAYGALCWNLSKAIPRKDLPHVYNTYLPVSDVREEPARHIPLEDFDKSRTEVREEVERAPYRRLDNVISRLHQYTRRLRVHAQVLNQLRSERFRLNVNYFGVGLLVVLTGVLLIYAMVSFGGESKLKYSIIIGAITLVVGAALVGVYTWDRKLREKNLSLDALFERTFARELTLGDEADDLRALWGSVRDRVRKALDAKGRFPRLGRGDMRRMERVVSEDVPSLRSLASTKSDSGKVE